MVLRRFEDLADAFYAARREEEGALEALHAELGWVSAQLEQTDYLAGDSYTLAEPGVWPWITRLYRVGVDIGQYPAIATWCDRLAERPGLDEPDVATRGEAADLGAVGGDAVAPGVARVVEDDRHGGRSGEQLGARGEVDERGQPAALAVDSGGEVLVSQLDGAGRAPPFPRGEGGQGG
jgi:hypothetical protein